MALSESYWRAHDEGTALVDMTVGGMLAEAAAVAGDRTALVEGIPDPGARRRWTYAELLSASEDVARALLSRFEPGERVAVWAPNVAEWVLLEFGCALAGVVMVTVNPALRGNEVSYILAQSRSAGIFVMDEFRGNPMLATIGDIQADLPELREIIPLSGWDEFLATTSGRPELPEIHPGDPVQIQYTSGTTGFPKGVLLHHRGIVNNARLTAERAGVAEFAPWLNPMPLFHTGGCVLGALGAVSRRSAHVPVLAFDPALVMELIETEGCQVMGAVPTMLIAMMEHPDFATRDLGSMRAVISGGSTVPAPLVRRIEEELGVDFTIVFGQTECSPVATMTRTTDSIEDKAETIGQPLPHTEVKIIDPESGATLPVGEAGEFLTRGYHVMLGYFEMPEATAEAIDSDGWLHTGDLCSMDERGYCQVVGRLKDMIIRGGENIYPREIEDLLFSHPAVAEVAVVGVPDEKWGEQVAAFVRLVDDTVDHQELFAFCREGLAPHKTPRHWVTVDEWPMTGSGKIQKFALVEKWVAGEFVDPRN